MSWRVTVTPRSVIVGLLAVLSLATFYGVVVGLASSSLDHVTAQVREDWYFLTPILVGFGIQVALLAELRHRNQLRHGAAAAGGAGAGASTAGMVACCAHHLIDIVPIAGATGAAAFLIDYRAPFMLVGIGVNGVGIAVATRRLRASSRVGIAPKEVEPCTA
jgi:hypothetical protein